VKTTASFFAWAISMNFNAHMGDVRLNSLSKNPGDKKMSGFF
jgi:hypothetical protein